MRVRDWMNDSPITANLRDGAHQTFTRMHEHGIRHMPVLGEDGRLAGMVSDRDLRRPDSLDDDPNVVHPWVLDNHTRVESLMTPRPLTVQAEAPLVEALDAMVEHRFGALPVLDGERLVGVISATDLLRAYRQHLGR